MKAPSTLSIPHSLNFIIFCFTFFPFVWLVMTCVTSPISDKLRISRMVDADGEVLMDLGVFGGCADGLQDLVAVPARDLAECTRQAPGYSVMVFLPLDDPEAPTGRQFSTIPLLEREDTRPMILVPIATGLTGLSTVLLVAAWIGGGRRWAILFDKTNMGFHWVCTLITWITFGVCLRVTQITRDRVVNYNNNEDAILATPLEMRYGNAVWLTLVSAILVLIASMLYTLKTFWGPAKTEPTYTPHNRDLDMEGKRSPKQQKYTWLLGA